MVLHLFIAGLSALIATTTTLASIIQNKPRDGVLAFDMRTDYSSALTKRQVAQHDYFLPVKAFPKIVLQIGSNKDEVELDVDTGSWLVQIPDVATNCTTCLLPSGKLGLYNSNKSTTAVKTGKAMNSNFYKTAYYHGEGVIDDIWFGPNFKIPNTLFNDVQDIGSSWSFGILGLAKPPYGEDDLNIVWNAYRAGLIAQPIISINQRNSSGNSLQLIIGGYSKSQMVEDYTWTSIYNENLVAQIDFVNINGTEVRVDRNVVFDTGNYYVFANAEVVDALLASFPDDPNNKRGSHKIDYNLIQDKTMTVSIYGKNYTIPLQAFVEPDCTGQHCEIIIYESKQWNWGSAFNRFLNIALNYGDSTFIGIAEWKPSNTNEIVSF
ncbi:uncharacterized protein KGF55_001543 [Candida pseudojiufengensis]|uniref:uncharacterized protein n=1 Tax=Candida pseudojiufengensis TaxID=497109 RepID=UPI002223F6B8|nr:uncharacterized protein KGF55_001543 [Candida pseudojiufengensis]KAI5965322.1 hypothetical protein KGF55_001543 [Candida pseudojiufengensis]